jgi:hypothetical protein
MYGEDLDEIHWCGEINGNSEEIRDRQISDESCFEGETIDGFQSWEVDSSNI